MTHNRSKGILYGLKYIVNFLKRESWKGQFTEVRGVCLTEEERALIIGWLVHERVKLSHPFLRNYYKLSDEGIKTLQKIVETLQGKEELEFTEYELGFMAYWLHKVRKGLDQKVTIEQLIVYLDILKKFNDSISESELKETLEKIIEKTMENKALYHIS